MTNASLDEVRQDGGSVVSRAGDTPRRLVYRGASSGRRSSPQPLKTTEQSVSTEAHVKDCIDLWQWHVVSMGVDGTSGVDD